MRRALSLDGPKLPDIQVDALGVLTTPSELKIIDVQEIFTRFKKVPAEKIIARLLGEVYKPQMYSRRLQPPTKGSSKRTNIKSHETWYARACNGGGRGSDTFNGFMHASFIDYNFFWPPGKSSTPRKPAKTSGAKKYTPELLRQAHQAVAQRKDLVQALSEASTAMVMQESKQKATERLGRQMHYEKAQAEAKATEQGELATKMAVELQQSKKAHRQTKIAAAENVRLVREQEAEKRRWEKERERVMRIAGNKERVAQKAVQREQLKRKAADERAEEALEKAGEEKQQRRKAEKENKQLASKNQVLAKLPFVAVAAAHAEANVSEKKRQKMAKQLQKKEGERQLIEERAKVLVEKMISSNRMVNVLTGEKRKGLNKIEKEARKKAKEYYGDPLRRDKEREQQAAMDGAFDDIVRERDEALEARDECTAMNVELQQEVDRLQGELDTAIAGVNTKQALVDAVQEKFAQVGIMRKVGKMYSNEYRLLLMSVVGNCSSVYQARTMYVSLHGEVCMRMDDGGEGLSDTGAVLPEGLSPGYCTDD